MSKLEKEFRTIFDKTYDTAYQNGYNDAMKKLNQSEPINKEELLIAALKHFGNPFELPANIRGQYAYMAAEFAEYILSKDRQEQREKMLRFANDYAEAVMGGCLMRAEEFLTSLKEEL